MRFAKVRDVKTPVRSTPGSAGIDFFIPNDFPKFYLTPGTDILIPSGIKMEIPEGYALLGVDKSGIATSYRAKERAGLTTNPPRKPLYSSSLLIGAKLIDQDYQGEIHIHIINVGTGTEQLLPGMKIAQFVLIPVNYAGLEEVAEDRLFTEKTERSSGGFGSTGVK